MTTAIVGFPTGHDNLGRAARSATVIQFPADHCRKPAKAIEAAERAAYELAAKDYATKPGSAASIEAMMRLACEGCEDRNFGGCDLLSFCIFSHSVTAARGS